MSGTFKCDCEHCSHYIEKTCGWEYMYSDTDYADDCIDFTPTQD